MASFGLTPGEEVVSGVIRYDAVNEEVLMTTKDKLDGVKTAAAGTAASADNLTRKAQGQDIAFRALSSTLILANSGLNRMGLLSDSTANSINTLIGVVQLLRVAQTAYKAAVDSETASNWANAVSRAAAWVAANPIFGAIVVGAIAAAVVAISALKVSGKLAEGGIVTSPGLFQIAEGGRSEAVIPLGTPEADRMLGGGGRTVNVTLIGDPRSWDRELRELLG